MTLETGDKEEPKQRWKRWKKNRWQKEESPSCGYLYFVSALLFSTWRKKHCFFPFCLFLVMKGSKNLEEREGQEKQTCFKILFYSMREMCLCMCFSFFFLPLHTDWEMLFFFFFPLQRFPLLQRWWWWRFLSMDRKGVFTGIYLWNEGRPWVRMYYSIPSCFSCIASCVRMGDKEGNYLCLLRFLV